MFCDFLPLQWEGQDHHEDTEGPHGLTVFRVFFFFNKRFSFTPASLSVLPQSSVPSWAVTNSYLGYSLALRCSWLAACSTVHQWEWYLQITCGAPAVLEPAQGALCSRIQSSYWFKVIYVFFLVYWQLNNLSKATLWQTKGVSPCSIWLQSLETFILNSWKTLKYSLFQVEIWPCIHK